MSNDTRNTGLDSMIDEARKIADSTPAEVMQRLASGQARDLRHDRDQLIDALVVIAQTLPYVTDLENYAPAVAKVASVAGVLADHADTLDDLTGGTESLRAIATAEVARADQEA